MFELILMTVISAPNVSPIIETQAIETTPLLERCLELKSDFQPRQMQLPTGQILTIKLSCEKRR